MRFLLDTHTLLWFALNDARLSSRARSLMADRGNELLVSPATYWEIAIKVSLGKYALAEDFAQFMERQISVNHLTILAVTVQHAAVVSTLPFHHKDPFDRLLVAQALTERIPLLSADAALDTYSVARVW